MFGIGPTELIVILVIALIVVGPERLPTLAGQIGKAIRDFRQMSGDMTGEFQRAFQLDEPTQQQNPLLSDEIIGPSATPNGFTDSATILAPQIIPSEAAVEAPAEATPVASEPAPQAEPETAPVTTANGSHAAVPLATKAEPLADVSFLDEPEEEAPQVYESMPVASFGTPTDPIADAWQATLTTDATISLPEPTAEEAQPEAAETAVALAEPPPAVEETPVDDAPPARPRIDPSAEVTIREVIEGQVAAEAFRERRRLAKYRRHK